MFSMRRPTTNAQPRGAAVGSSPRRKPTATIKPGGVHMVKLSPRALQQNAQPEGGRRGRLSVGCVAHDRATRGPPRRNEAGSEGLPVMVVMIRAHARPQPVSRAAHAVLRGRNGQRGASAGSTCRRPQPLRDTQPLTSLEGGRWTNPLRQRRPRLPPVAAARVTCAAASTGGVRRRGRASGGSRRRGAEGAEGGGRRANKMKRPYRI